jgi:ribosomal protein S18 acetylase RimI-like enzyme
MVLVETASERDIISVVDLDGHESHRRILTAQIRASHCWVARHDGIIIGFVTADDSFYEQGFICLLAVHREHRRRGVATTLVRYVESVCPTQKLFTSTNQSNIPAQKLFESSGFVHSGVIENLDEADPEIVYFKRVR